MVFSLFDSARKRVFEYIVVVQARLAWMSATCNVTACSHSSARLTMSAPLKPAGRRVAVVTGANKGIGLEIARGLLRELSDTTDVVLTARDVQRGEAAAQ